VDALDSLATPQLHSSETAAFNWLAPPGLERSRAGGRGLMDTRCIDPVALVHLRLSPGVDLDSIDKSRELEVFRVVGID
jgi:hypothetical protein